MGIEASNVNSLDHSLCVVGIGAMSAVGLDAPANAAAIRAGISNFQEHPFMINREGDPYMLAMVPAINETLMGFNRHIELLKPAITEALSPLKAFPSSEIKLKVGIGLAESRPGIPGDMEARLIDECADLLNDQFKLDHIGVECRGHAAGLVALDSAMKRILAGKSEFEIIGGVDSYIDPDMLDWIEDNEQLHVPTNAWGFIPGEAAGFCLICSEVTAQKYQLPIRAKLLGVAIASEKNKIKTETVCIGQGLTQAVRDLLPNLPEGSRIGPTICDQNGEAYRADEHGFMMCRLSDYFSDPTHYIAPADCWGDVGAASAPLFINLAIAANEKCYAKGNMTLAWMSSEGGTRAAALISSSAVQRGLI